MKVCVALSGGVDSAVSAYLLKDMGYDVMGLHMNNYPEFTGEDLDDVRKVAKFLNIPLVEKNIVDLFEREIINYFYKEYLSGKTPNPCILCNRKIKFGKLYEFSRELKCDFFSTGHFVKKKMIKENFYLCSGKDNTKDQVYFLSRVKKDLLKYLLFPLGDYTKEEVRSIAKKAGIPVFSKKDSQEICFIKDDNYKNFLIQRGYKTATGNIQHIDGEILGKHKGLAFYTIGQRKGLGISYKEKLYVVNIDLEKNTLIVGSKKDLLNKQVTCINPYFFKHIDKEFQAYCKIRFNMEKRKAKITICDDNSIIINFEDPVSSVTPGQLAVFYNDSNCVIGSAFIK